MGVKLSTNMVNKLEEFDDLLAKEDVWDLTENLLQASGQIMQVCEVNDSDSVNFLHFATSNNRKL